MVTTPRRKAAATNGKGRATPENGAHTPSSSFTAMPPPSSSSKKRNRSSLKNVDDRSPRVVPGHRILLSPWRRAFRQSRVSQALGHVRRTFLVRQPGVAATEESTPPPPPPTPPPVVQKDVTLLLVGPEQAGKTALVQSFVDRTEPVSGLDEKDKKAWQLHFHHKDFAFAVDDHDVTSVRLKLWDTSSSGPTVKEQSKSEDFDRILDKTDGVLLCLSVRNTCVEDISATSVEWKTWLEQKRETVPVHLVLTQADHCCAMKLDDEARSALNTMCRVEDFLSCQFTSAKFDVKNESAMGVDDLFCRVVNQTTESGDQDVKEQVDEDDGEPPAKRARKSTQTARRKKGP